MQFIFSRLCTHDSVIVNVSAPCYLCYFSLLLLRALLHKKQYLEFFKLAREHKEPHSARNIGSRNENLSLLIVAVNLYRDRAMQFLFGEASFEERPHYWM